MQLSRFQAVAKSRSGWAALDLGCVMARAWFFKLWLAWIIPAGICFVVLSVIFNFQPAWAGFITWLLKPVWERPLLFVASQQLFGEQVSARDIYQNYLRVNKKDWLWWLSLRRILPSRAFLMPVTVLEGLGGSVRAKRVSLLQRRFSGPATWLLISAVHIELFVIFALLAAFYILLPAGIEVQWQSLLFEYEKMSTHALNGVWLLSASLIAPFYVCSGFSLYLQRRIDLEAWDIEIQFRQLADRLREKQKRRVASASAVIFALFIGAASFSSPELLANAESTPIESSSENVSTAESELVEYERTVENSVESSSVESSVDSSVESSVESPEDQFDEYEQPSTTDAVDTSFERAEVKNQAHELLSQKPFFNERIEHTLKFEREEKDSLIPEWLINFLDWLDANGGIFSGFADVLRNLAKFFELILWVVVISVIVLVLWRYRKWLGQAMVRIRGERNDAMHEAPKALFGIDLHDEPLPEDIVGEANKYWRDGEQRLAFSLILRATLLRCVELGCRFKDGHTENECASIVRKQLSVELSTSFNQLISSWQKLAYAHQACDEQTFAALCSNYSTFWQGVK